MIMKNEILIPDDIITNKIYMIRGLKGMLDRDLASLYNVETKQLKGKLEEILNDFLKILCSS